MNAPARIQRKRSKGWRRPAGAVCVTRLSRHNPGPWGNPFVKGPDGDREAVVAKHRAWLLSQPDLMARVRRELAGKSLACWCKPGELCHGDTLFHVANSGGQP